ncbi:hypothetical protein CgunFtcFv8_001645 [Champsocephalus gunnari]|uniref:Ankyrin repeat domain 61 n=1 Tax=Champsocephalus gunnari TaxID=52237 RepID=A0AAN8CNT5_CHAGU|nr:hypothetical protein CgunFtcFv8_001645 [Champsocephalus gunnari]
MSNKYWGCFLPTIGDTPGEDLWKGLSTLPLHLAATYRRAASLQSLLTAGEDPEIRDQLGRTTLHLVIASWPSISPKPGSRFQAAVSGERRGAEACLRLLCEHGVNLNAEVEGSQQTALHLSVRYTALSAVHILSCCGADVNAVDSSGMTALHMAAGILHKDIMVSLIKEGADLSMGVKPSGNTPLHLAVVSMTLRAFKTLQDDTSCISELLERGAEVNAVNNAGITPLHEACSMGNTELVELLLRYGANINQLSGAGESCLFLFLNHRLNVRNNSLLIKLLSLTSPLTFYNHNNSLPLTLTRPCFFKQRDQLLKLTQQPRSLQDICKRDIYLKHVQGTREELGKILPVKLYDFVFNYWEDLHISFVTDGDQDSFNDLLHIAPS